jgi:hypothetical protein
LTPILTPGVIASSIALGASQSFMRISGGGGLKCWGRSDFGQLGIGSAAQQQINPVDMGIWSNGAGPVQGEV